MKIFISHSSEDSDLAEAIVDLLRSAIPLTPQDIRCTSVDGYRLPAGANTNDQLRREVAEAKAFIGIISKASLNSAYVIFELGARWGKGTHLAPLLVPGLEAALLQGPLQGINALRADSPAQLYQLVDEIGSVLELQLSSASSYQKKVERITAFTKAGDASSSRNDLRKEEVGNGAIKSVALLSFAPNSLDEVERQIRERVNEQHPGDFSTQRYVIAEQLKDWRALREFSDSAVPTEVLAIIFQKAMASHPYDFSTQLYVVREQVTDWKSLHLRS